jgi:hypothetical protein
MKVVYVAGKFRSTNPDGTSNAWGVCQNVRAAEEVGLAVWKLGHAALVPHLNTAHFQDADGLPDKLWLDGDLEILRRCDAVVLVPGWERSKGALAEITAANQLGIPVFDGADDFALNIEVLLPEPDLEDVV